MNDRQTRRMTLADVKALLARIYTGDTLRIYTRTLDRVEELAGRKLVQLPADEKAWADIASTIVWTGTISGRTPEAAKRSFDELVTRVGGMIRRTQELVTPSQPVDAAADLAWDLFEAYVREVENTCDEAGRLVLPNMASVSVASLRRRLGHLHPAAIDHAAATQALHVVPADKAASFRRSVRFFDGLIIGRERHPTLSGLLPPKAVGPLPGLRNAALDWSRFTPAFRASVDEVIGRAIRGDRPVRDRFEGRLGEDRLADRRAGKGVRKKKVRKPEVARKNYLLGLSWLVRHAFEPRETAYSAERLAEVFTAQAVSRAAKTYLERSRADEALLDARTTSSLGTYLATLSALARAARLGDEVLMALEDARYDHDIGAPTTAEMSATRAAFVKLVDRDPAKARAIVTGPRVLADAARRSFSRWEDLKTHERSHALHLCMASCMLAIQIARPLRTLNVNSMTIGGVAPELLAPAREGGAAWLDIAKTRTKNRKPLESPLTHRAWATISLWLEVGRPLWLAHHADEQDSDLEDENVEAGDAGTENDSIYLFPGAHREDEVCRGVINRAWNKGMELLGLPGLTPHVMRHVCATLYLAKHPGDYATVAALLADKLSTVERFYIRGEGRAAAELFAKVIEELDPSLKLKAELPKPSRTAA